MRVRVSIAALAAGVAVFAASAAGAGGPVIFTVAGNSGHGFSGDGSPATSATLEGPAGLVAAPDGAIYVSDTIDQRIRRIDPTGHIQTIAGTGDHGFAGDGGPAIKATLQDPTALARGADGTLFVADTGNNRIRAIRPDETIVTVAGSSDDGFAGDGGLARNAQISGPAGLALAPNGDLFFSDADNNRIRVVHANGIIDTVAGTGQPGFAGDNGPARAAALHSPAGLALAPDGSLLIADTGNNRVRRIAPNGTISTVAGNGGGGSGGDGGPATAAQLNAPVDVAVRPDGSFFVAERGGNRIRVVDAHGTIARLAGTGAPRFGGDGHAPTRAYVNAPHAIELLPSARELLIADTDNNRIRYVGVPGQSSLLALALSRRQVRAPLRRHTVTVHRHKRRTLAIPNIAIRFTLTKAASLGFRITTKSGKQIATLKKHADAGTGTLRLPRRLRSGKHRLKKDHYVVGVTALAGSARATTSFALTVK